MSTASKNRFVVNWESIIEKYDKEFPDADVLDLDTFSIVADRGELQNAGFSSKPFGSCRLAADKKRHAAHDGSSEDEEYDDLALSHYAESVLSCTLETLRSQGINPVLSSPEDIERELKVHSMITASDDPSDGETIGSSDSEEVSEEYDKMLFSSDELVDGTESSSSAASGQPGLDQSIGVINAGNTTETNRADGNTGVKKTLNFSSGISPICQSDSELSDDDQFLSLGESPAPKRVPNHTPVDREKVRLTLRNCSPLRHVSARARVTGIVPPRQSNVDGNNVERVSNVLQTGVGENTSTEGFAHNVPDRPVSVPEPVPPNAEHRSRPLISVIQDLAGSATRGFTTQNEERMSHRRLDLTNRNAKYDDLDGRVAYDRIPERMISAYQSVPPNLVLSVASSNDAPFSASNMQLFQLVPIGGQQNFGLSSFDQRRTSHSGQNSGFDLDRSNHRELLPNHSLSQSSNSQFPQRNDASVDGVRQEFVQRSTPAGRLPVPFQSSRTTAGDGDDPSVNSAQPSLTVRQASNAVLDDVDMRANQTDVNDWNLDCEALPGHSNDRLPEHSNDVLPGHSNDRLSGHTNDRLPGHSNDLLPGHSNDRLDLQSPSSSRSFLTPRSDKQEMTVIKKKESLQMMSDGFSPKQHRGQHEQVSSPQSLENSNNRFSVASESVTKTGETFQSPSWKIPTRPQTPKSSGVTPTRYSTKELMNIFQSSRPLRFGSPTTNIQPSPKQRSIKKELSAVFQSEPPKLIHVASPLLDRREMKSAVRDPWKICKKECTIRSNTVGDQFKKNLDSSNIGHEHLKLETKQSSVVHSKKKSSTNFGTLLESKKQPRALRDTLDDIDGVKSSPQHSKVLCVSTNPRSPMEKDSLRLELASAVNDQTPRSPCIIKSSERKHSPSSKTKPRRIILTALKKLNYKKCQKQSDETRGLDKLQSRELQDTPSALREDRKLAGGSPYCEEPLGSGTKQDPLRSPLHEKQLVRLQRMSECDKMNKKQILRGKPSPRNRKILDELQSLEKLRMTPHRVSNVDASDRAFKSPPNDEITNRQSEIAIDRKLGAGDVLSRSEAIVSKPSLSRELGADYQCFQPNLCSTVIGDASLPESSSQSEVEDEPTQLDISSQEKVEKWLSGYCLESPEQVISDGGMEPEIVDNEIQAAEEVVSLSNASHVGQNQRDLCMSSKTGSEGSFAKKTFADILMELKAEADKKNEHDGAGDARADIVSLSSKSTVLSRKVGKNLIKSQVADANDSPKLRMPKKLAAVAKFSPKNLTSVKRDGALPKPSVDSAQNRHSLAKYEDVMSPKLCSKREERLLELTPKNSSSVERVRSPIDSVVCVDKNNNSIQRKKLTVLVTSSGSTDCNVLNNSDTLSAEKCMELTNALTGSAVRQEKLKASDIKLDAGHGLRSPRREKNVGESKLLRTEPQVLRSKDTGKGIVCDLESVRVSYGFRSMDEKEDAKDFTKIIESDRTKKSRKRKFQYNSDSDSKVKSKLVKVEQISRKSSQNEKVDSEDQSGRKMLDHKPGILHKSTGMPLSDSSHSRMLKVSHEKTLPSHKSGTLRKSSPLPFPNSSDSRILKVSHEKKSVNKQNTGGEMCVVPRIRKEVTFIEPLYSSSSSSSSRSSDDISSDEEDHCPSLASPCVEPCLGEGRCNKSFCFDCV